MGLGGFVATRFAFGLTSMGSEYGTTSFWLFSFFGCHFFLYFFPYRFFEFGPIGVFLSIKGYVFLKADLYNFLDVNVFKDFW